MKVSRQYASGSGIAWLTLIFGLVELGVIVGKRGRDIPEADAESYVAGYGNDHKHRWKCTHKSKANGHMSIQP